MVLFVLPYCTAELDTRVSDISHLTAVKTAGRILTGLRTAKAIGLPYALRVHEEGDLLFKIVSLDEANDKSVAVIGETRKKALRVSFTLRPGVPATEAPIIVKLEPLFA